jgi:hypothetical protein
MYNVGLTLFHIRGGKNERKNISRGVEGNEKFVNTIRRMVCHISNNVSRNYC